MTEFTKGIIALSSAVIIGFLPTPLAQNKTLNTLISVIVGLFVYFILWAAPKFRDWVAIQLVQFFAYGLKLWAESRANQIDEDKDDSVWDWLDGQLLVAQRRYAFSISCIAFHRNRDNNLQCLLVWRTFPGMDHNVLLWPGGRFIGIETDIEEAIKRLVARETGGTIELIKTNTFQMNGNREIIASYPSPDTKNELFPAPLFIMQQNRKQRYGIRGHIDLVYLAEVQHYNPRKNSMMVNLTDLDSPSEDSFWSDTKACIRRASLIYETQSRP